MQDLKTLQEITKDGLAHLKKEKGLIEGLVYASSNERTIGRIFYTSHLPSTGLEEPKSDTDYGVSVEMWFEDKGKKLVGMGYEPNDLSLDAVKRAIAKARRDAVEDNEFHGFLKKSDLPKSKKTPDQIPVSARTNPSYGDSRARRNDKNESELIVKLSWETIEGAIDALTPFAKKHKLLPEKLAFILNGDNFLIKERMALATTNGIEDSDETSLILSFITGMLEKENAKGSAWGAEQFNNTVVSAKAGLHTPSGDSRLRGNAKKRIKTEVNDDFSAYTIGKEAALAAINGIGGVRVPSGKYRVVFGHQAVAELIGSLLSPHVNLGMIDVGASLFLNKYGQQVASELFTLYDDATLPGGAGSKRVTCEGYPTGKTLLIDSGKLVGYLSDSRTTNKILHNREKAKMVLGVDPHEIRQAISPRNGFRFDRGGGRVAAAGVGIHATNLVVDSPKPVAPEKLLREIGDGIFIGRLWYTYPVGGYASGIISGTAIADCYTIKNGKLAEPITPNSLRLEDNLGEMIKNIIGNANNQRPTILWASDEITHAPWIGIDNVQFFAINESH